MKKFLFAIFVLVALAAIGFSCYILFIDNMKVTISFDTNMDKRYENMEINKGESINLPNMERDGYEFLGWYVGDTRVDSNYKFNKATVIVAKWKELKRTYTISFNTDGGSNIDSISIDCGTISLPNPPTKEGFVFSEWHDENGNVVDYNSTLSCQNITLKAIWKEDKPEEQTFTVTFDSNGGSAVPSQTVKYGEKATLPANPTKKNSIFSGWQLNGSTYNFNSPVTADITLTAVWINPGNIVDRKPLLYLYPEKEMHIEVKLGNMKDITSIYPRYNNGWNVKAYPNGKLIDNNTGRELYGLYWEGKDFHSQKISDGFVVKGTDTIEFLEEKLAILGLNEREAEEFIIYWLPQMEHNNYNFIHFAAKEELDNYMPLEINPKPDTVIRILMEFMPLEEKMNIQEQKLIKEERKGYTAIEWGGALINQTVIK